jgi:membrane associated rhomboid family serine protease
MTDFRPGGFQQLPLIVKNLLIINALVFLLQNVLAQPRIGINLDDLLALHYWGSPLFRWWQVISHMFMHGSITHIVFNMFALWMFGRVLENMWGPQRFLLFYLVCGIGAAFCHLAVMSYQFMPFHEALTAYQAHPNPSDFISIANRYPMMGVDINYLNSQFLEAWRNDPASVSYASTSIDLLKTHMNEATVGASGAVYGLLFAFAYLFPNTELYIYFIPIPIKAKWVVTGFVVLELFSGIRNSATDNVAHFAHLGGMLFAFILLRIWNRKIRNRFY